MVAAWYQHYDLNHGDHHHHQQHDHDHHEDPHHESHHDHDHHEYSHHEAPRADDKKPVNNSGSWVPACLAEEPTQGEARLQI